ncbi:hypothetical protein A3Q56_01957, partial [Intoshia linei]
DFRAKLSRDIDKYSRYCTINDLNNLTTLYHELDIINNGKITLMMIFNLIFKKHLPKTKIKNLCIEKKSKIILYQLNKKDGIYIDKIEFLCIIPYIMKLFKFCKNKN